MANEPQPARPEKAANERWLTLSSAAIGVLAFVTAVLADDAFNTINWMLVALAVVAYETSRHWHRTTRSALAVAAVASTGGLWMTSFAAAVIWHHTGPHAPFAFYGVEFAIWVLWTAYLLNEVARVKRSPPSPARAQ